MALKLDKTDRKILELIQSDASLSASEIADRVNLSRAFITTAGRAGYQLQCGLERGEVHHRVAAGVGLIGWTNWPQRQRGKIK